MTVSQFLSSRTFQVTAFLAFFALDRGVGPASAQDPNFREYIRVGGRVVAIDSKAPPPTSVSLTISSTPSNLTARIAGQGTDVSGPTSLVRSLAPGQYTVSVQAIQNSSATVRHVFTAWSDGDTAATKNVNLTQNTTLTAQFRTEYRLDVQISPLGLAVSPISPASGWVPAGETVSFSVPAADPADHVFSSWTGLPPPQGQVSARSGSFQMSGPVTLSANYTSTSNPPPTGTAVRISLQTDPPGLRLRINSNIEATAPTSYDWPVAQGCLTLEAFHQDPWIFSKWADNGSLQPSRPCFVPQAGNTYTAVFLRNGPFPVYVNPARMAITGSGVSRTLQVTGVGVTTSTTCIWPVLPASDGSLVPEGTNGCSAIYTSPTPGVNKLLSIRVTANVSPTSTSATADISLSVGANHPPNLTYDTSPTMGTGTSTVVIFNGYDLNGYSDIKKMQLLVARVQYTSPGLHPANACDVYADLDVNRFYLTHDLGGGFVGNGRPGDAAISNSQCTLDLASLSIFPFVASVRMPIPLSFRPSMQGLLYAYGSVQDTGNLSSYVYKNLWNVPDTTPPALSSLSVTAGSQTATVTWNTLNDVSTTQAEFWTPANAGSPFSTAVDAVPREVHSIRLTGLSPSTTYTVRAKSADPSGNLGSTTATFTTTASGPPPTNRPVFKEDFEVSTDYSYVAPLSQGIYTLYPEGLYTIHTNPNLNHNLFSSFTDHTSGSGRMLIANGKSSAPSVWSRTVSGLLPGNSYTLRFWAASAHSASPARLQFKVNGAFVGTAVSLPSASPPAVPWTQVATQFTAAAPSALIEIFDLNVEPVGNDFVVDDIEVTEQGTNAAVFREDFEVLSQYDYVPPGNNSLWNEGTYTIDTTPRGSHIHFIDFGDHTTSLGRMLVANGRSVANSVRSRTVSGLVVGQQYRVRLFAKSAYNAAPAELQFKIGGALTGPRLTLAINPPIWQELSTAFTATSVQTTVDIINHNTIPGGNDFVIDDIELGLASVTPGVAEPITIFGTGGAAGAPDARYTLIQSADTQFPGPSAIVATSIPSPPWLANSATSAWIAPSASQSFGNAPGVYVYRTTFDLTGFDPATARLNLSFATDDGGQLRLNGVTVPGINSGGFQNFTSATITSGFRPGINTLDFVVTNAGTTANPTGLRVEASATAVRQ